MWQRALLKYNKANFNSPFLSRYCAMWMKPGIDFTNVLLAASARVDPKSVKDTEDLTEFLRFWDLWV